MGTHKNSDVEPHIFKLKNKEISSNQKEFRVNFLQQLLLEQAKMNHSMRNSVEKVNKALQMTNATQDNQHQLMINKLHNHEQFYEQMHQYIQKQEMTNELIMKRLTTLEDRNEVILEKIEAERLLTQAILDQQSTHDQALDKLTANIEEEKSVITQLKKQDELFDEFNSKLDLQEVFHKTVMERLDQQEGIMKKIIGELDHLRSIIFERASHIVEKIEDNVRRITKPIQHFIVDKETKEKEKVD